MLNFPNDWFFSWTSALSELFDKADSSRDGTISIKEYVDMCETYGVELNEEDIREVLEIADENGEVPLMK